MEDERTHFESLSTSHHNKALLQSCVVTIEVRAVSAVTHWHANRGQHFSDVITDPVMLMARVGAHSIFQWQGGDSACQFNKLCNHFDFPPGEGT
jgi:hypothetical protein